MAGKTKYVLLQIATITHILKKVIIISVFAESARS